MSWATIAQYESRYGDVAAADEAMLQECLDDATSQMNAALDAAAIDYSSPSTEYARCLMMVCRQMAHRAFGNNGSELAPFGVSQTSQTAGPYTQYYSFSNPYGDLFMTRSEQRMLGIGRPYIGSVHPVVDGPRLVRRWGDVCDL